MTKAVEEAILEKKTAQRVRNNLDAIKLVRDMKTRDYAATPEEQAGENLDPSSGISRRHGK